MFIFRRTTKSCKNSVLQLYYLINKYICISSTSVKASTFSLDLKRYLQHKARNFAFKCNKDWT
uniref:Putative ovule protein n=1 Tax=Solanum chacoense TaxID=4108 RepID=A0A0V0GRQ7_SOLCH